MRHWSKTQGVPNAILCILQSKEGFIWIGTYEGLFKYDGHEFKKYSVRNTSALKHNTIWALEEGIDGTIWIGTEKGVLNYKNGTFKKVTKTEHFIYSLHVTRNNQLFVGTRGYGVWLLDPISNDYKEIKDESALLKNVDVLSILEKGNNIWLGTNKGIYKYNNKKIEIKAKSFSTENGQTGSLVETLHMDRNKNIWIGTNVGLFYIQNDSIYNDPQFNGYQIFRLKSDKKNVLWVGTSDGLFFYKKNKKPSIFSYEENKKFHLHAFTEDNEGNWWIGTLRSGLFQIIENKFININKNLETPQIGSLGFDKNGKLLIGSVNGVVSRWNNNEVKPWFTTLSTGRVYYILSDRNQNTWIATYNGLTKISSNGKSTVLTSNDGLSGGLYRYVYQDIEGNYWIGTRDGGISIIDDNNSVLKKWNTSNGLSSNFIMSIVPYHDKGMLVSTAGGGLNLINGDSVYVLKQENGLSSNVVFHSYTDRDKVIWAVSTLGLDRIEWHIENEDKKWKITNYGIKQKIPDESPFSYLEDDLGYVWMPSASGLMRVRKESLNQYHKDKKSNIIWELYTSEDGLTSTNCAGATHAAKDEKGHLYFPTFNGAIAVNPINFIDSLKSGPSVYITEFRINQKQSEKSDDMKLPPGPHRISLKFTTPYFTNHDDISIKYKLKGIDKDWIEASKERTATYTNIGFGKYTFEVNAINKEGKWEPKSSIWKFSVKAHFYETIWFYISAIILIVCLIVALFRLRMNKLQKAKLRLEAIVENRTSQIALKNEQLTKNLLERESLLKEIHHRVKNNLQVIASLLYLQSEKSNNNDIKKVLEEGQGRVRSMALIHQKLYENEDLKSIPFDEYMRELISEIRFSFGKVAEQVQLNVEAENIFFDVDTAIPLGLIINELSTNAFKYAYKNQIAPAFNISLKRENERDYHMKVSDNGIGLPDEFLSSSKPTSLGLKLTRMLSMQLEGDYNFDNANGTTYELRFAV